MATPQQYDNQYKTPGQPEPSVGGDYNRTMLWWGIIALVIIAALAFGAYEYRNGYVTSATEIGTSRAMVGQDNTNPNNTEPQDTTATIPATSQNYMGGNASSQGTPASPGTPATSSPAPEATPAPSGPAATSTPAPQSTPATTP